MLLLRNCLALPQVNANANVGLVGVTRVPGDVLEVIAEIYHSTGIHFQVVRQRGGMVAATPIFVDLVVRFGVISLCRVVLQRPLYIIVVPGNEIDLRHWARVPLLLYWVCCIARQLRANVLVLDACRF